MKRYNIIVGTVTHAIKGRDILRKKGFRVSIKKASGEVGPAGCSYAIVLEGNDIDSAVKILYKSGIIIKSVSKHE